MYNSYPYVPYVNTGTFYFGNPFLYAPFYPYFREENRQQPVRAQATWTDGGEVTKCNIPWSHNQYMTAAVGGNVPYSCGQMLKVKNVSTGKEISVTVVDQVVGYGANEINLHRKAFEALGGNLSEGIISVEVTPQTDNDLENPRVQFFLNVLQMTYPNFLISNYELVNREQVSNNRVKETYQFQLASQQETITVQTTITYHRQTNRIISFNVEEL